MVQAFMHMSLKSCLSKCGYFGYAAAALLILNLLDAIFTLGYVQLGAATEANPLMALPLSDGPIAFMLIKLSLVSFCVALLWRLQHHRGAVAAMFATTAIYGALVCYHISSIDNVVTYLALR